MGNLAAEASASPDGSLRLLEVPARWLHRSSREVPAGDRFDFCRQLAVGAHIERLLGARGDFFGDFRYTTTPDGIDFAEIAIDPCESRFGPGGDDTFVDIGLVNAGTAHIRHGRDQTLVLDAQAGPVLFDPARPLTVRTTRSDLFYLHLPRAAVVAAVGGAAVPRGAAVRPLAPGVLTTQLGACLRGLQLGSTQGAAAVGATLHTARALALVILASVRGAGHHWPGELDASLYRAARHQLAQRVADPRATADDIAGVLGCSRAQLYRLFAARGESVAGELRRLRMRRAAVLLRAQPHAAIAVIAGRCGYGEPIAFDKAFRRHFGMTPSDWRAARAATARPPAGPSARHGS